MTEGRFRRLRILGFIIATEQAWKDHYHRGYKAGSSKRYREEKKEVPLITTDGIPLTPVYEPIEPRNLGGEVRFDYTPDGNLRVSGIDVVVDNPPPADASDEILPTLTGT